VNNELARSDVERARLITHLSLAVARCSRRKRKRKQVGIPAFCPPESSGVPKRSESSDLKLRKRKRPAAIARAERRTQIFVVFVTVAVRGLGIDTRNAGEQQKIQR